MTLSGEYVPSTAKWVRDQVEAFEASNGADANTLRDSGDPIIVVTNIGAKTGKVRKTPLMRVERDGKYIAVASLGGAPKDPVWAYNVRANPNVELQDAPSRSRTSPASSPVPSVTSGGTTRSRPGAPTASTRRRPSARSRCSSWNRRTEPARTGGVTPLHSRLPSSFMSAIEASARSSTRRTGTRSPASRT